MTGNTSGHTTIATSTTSGTVSSGHVSVLSSVSETDMEVMETNKAGKIRVRRQRKLDSVVKSGNVDGCMSVHSSSTGSTNTNGYVALVGSPAPLREGASMPVDRFFDQSRIAVAHSVSNISGSTGSSGSAGGRTSRTSKTTDSLGPRRLEKAPLPVLEAKWPPLTPLDLLRTHLDLFRILIRTRTGLCLPLATKNGNRPLRSSGTPQWCLKLQAVPGKNQSALQLFDRLKSEIQALIALVESDQGLR